MKTLGDCFYRIGGPKKFELLGSYYDVIPFNADVDIEAPYCWIRPHTKGSLICIASDYAWDGPSGPTIDTADAIKGSLVHDVLYQLMREERLDHKWRKEADVCIREMCVRDGMPKWRAWLWYLALRVGGRSAAYAR